MCFILPDINFRNDILVWGYNRNSRFTFFMLDTVKLSLKPMLYVFRFFRTFKLLSIFYAHYKSRMRVKRNFRSKGEAIRTLNSIYICLIYVIFTT